MNYERINAILRRMGLFVAEYAKPPRGTFGFGAAVTMKPSSRAQAPVLILDKSYRKLLYSRLQSHGIAPEPVAAWAG